jgi:biopolymer transport protein ExbB
MIGLFGTVYGMILAFREIVIAGGSPDPVDLAAGIGTALTTTFWGLVVAIPALAGYAIVRNRFDALTSDADAAIEHLVNTHHPRAAAETSSDT